MTDLFERVVLPVADPDDAAATCAALTDYDVGTVVAVHVIEKAGGAVDKASVEQREEYAAEVFAVVEERLDDGVAVETEVVFGTDVADAIFAAAADADATSIVITPRGGSRWVRLLTGDVALSLVTENDRPVVVLPDRDHDDVEVDADVESAGDEAVGDGDAGDDPSGNDESEDGSGDGASGTDAGTGGEGSE